MKIIAYTDFTFQSGFILIISDLAFFGPINELYIPIWFYSNIKFQLSLSQLMFLYIPIWFYSNVNYKT